jgi:hypothetical protein
MDKTDGFRLYTSIGNEASFVGLVVIIIRVNKR